MEIYIHIPFCVQKCKYCDFLSAPADELTKEAYVNALCRELSYRSREYADCMVETVFIGGGTPSAIEAKHIERIMDILFSKYHIVQGAEISMEMNPATVTPETLRIYKRAGVNRLSIGLQSANALELKQIGRVHDYKQFAECYKWAREAGFKNINVDIMSALPEQTLDSYKETLEKIVALNPPPEHISAYSLILEEGTPLYQEYLEGKLNLPDEETERSMYEYTEEFLNNYQYKRYEISNYAKEGRECSHNIGYWRRADYLGFGIGAASKIGNKRFSNTNDITKYLDNPCDVYEEIQELTMAEEMEETMFLGLRMVQGVSMKGFEEKFGVSMETVYGNVLKKHMENGLLQKYECEEEDYVCLTAKGMDVSNFVMADFLEPVLFLK